MSSLINRAALKRHLLNRAKVLRPNHPFSRVSEEAIQRLESSLRLNADDLVRRHPSLGKTIKG